ncbi:hypothetical protein ACWEO1_05030 [Kitasatospora cineracea]
MTIRVYTVRADGARVQVSACTSDEDCFPPLVSALVWPACRCPRCGGRDAVREPDAA